MREVNTAKLDWDFSFGKSGKCVVCDERKTGVSMSVDGYEGDFVCRSCIDKYMASVQDKLKSVIGENGELYDILEDEEERIQRVEELANHEFAAQNDIYMKLAEIYSTLFTNGITSKTKKLNGMVDNREVKVSSRGIGKVSSWSNRARYGNTKEQIKIALQVWEEIVPILSNRRDRTEKFETLFETFTDEIAKYDCYDGLVDENTRVSIEYYLPEKMVWDGNSGATLEVTARNRTWGNNAIVRFNGSSTNLPVTPPDDDIWRWLDLLPHLETALQKAVNRSNDIEEAQNKIIGKVESAVAPWYTANSFV